MELVYDVFQVVIGIVVLHQIPTTVEVTGVLLVGAGVALHKERNAPAKHKSKWQTGESQPQ